MGMADVARFLLSGVSWGMLLFLIASGLALILGIMGIMNLAHGAFYMIGAYIGLTLGAYLGNYWLVAVVSGLAVGVFGFIIQRGLLDRLYKKFVDQVLLTLGLVYIITNATLWIWGAYPLFGSPPHLLDFSIPLGRLTFPMYRFALIFIGLLIAFGLWWFQEKTRAGAIVRAGMHDKDMTMGLGINYGLVSTMMFFIGAFLAGFAGFLGAPLMGAQWGMAFPTMLLAMVAVVVGGVGKVEGALLGALLVGVIDFTAKMLFPDFGMFTVWTIFIVVILVKPAGLLGRVRVMGAGGLTVPMQMRGVPRAFRQAWMEKLVNYVPYFLLGIILVFLPPFISPYLRSFMTQMLIFAVLACSLNLLCGYSGLISMGHGAFFGIAAYTVGIMSVRHGIDSFWITGAFGILLATLAAAFIAIFVLRVSGLYFIFVTLAVSELLASLAIKWVSFTGGSNGVYGIPYPNLGLPITLNADSFYYLVLIVSVISMYLMLRIMKSPYGLCLQGIRDNQRRMEHLRYNTKLFQYIAFVLSGLFAGVAGVLYAPFVGAVVPTNLGALISATVTLMCIIGGVRIFWGPPLGAALVLGLQYYTSIISPERWPMILGGIFVLTVLFLPGGIWHYITKLWNRVRYSYGSVEAG